MTLKIAVLAPIPSAMVPTAASENTGLRRNVRTANERSCSGMAHPTSFVVFDSSVPLVAKRTGTPSDVSPYSLSFQPQR